MCQQQLPQSATLASSQQIATVYSEIHQDLGKALFRTMTVYFLWKASGLLDQKSS
jgi:hypothetical protein